MEGATRQVGARRRVTVIGEEDWGEAKRRAAGESTGQGATRRGGKVNGLARVCLGSRGLLVSVVRGICWWREWRDERVRRLCLDGEKGRNNRLGVREREM